MRIILTVTAGPHKGDEFSFAEHDIFVVGRSERANFRLPQKDEYFSRFHFLIEVAPPHCRLTDMKSTNGTFVNGQRVTQADLEPGDQIQAGNTVLLVSVIDEQLTRQSPLVRLPPPLEVPSIPSIAAAEEEASFLGTLKPMQARERRTKAMRPIVVPATGPCLVCEAPVSATALNAPRLCADCQDQVRKHAQPIPGYLVARKLGGGTMGVVCLALHVDSARLVALKMVAAPTTGAKPDVERFLREASILKQLDHPHIVGFRDMGEVKGQFYLAMDYVRGTDTAGLLKQHGALPIRRAVTLVCQMLSALQYAHQKGFVHRDIKPANLMVAESNAGDRARLADFGLARVYQAASLSGLTLRDDIGGTPAFMAPEQITDYRNVGPAADQYAAAAMLYNLLTDRLIFDMPRSIDRALVKILNEEPVPIRTRRADLPAKLAEPIHRALSKQPHDRFADAGAFRECLLPFQNG